MLFAGVIVDISHEKLDKIFQYIIPEKLSDRIEVGQKVAFSFGKSARTGYVVEISEKPDIPVDKMKYLDEIVENGVKIDERLIKLAAWMKDMYGSTMIQALKTVIPVSQKVKSVQVKTVTLLISEHEAINLANTAREKKHVAKERLLLYLAQKKQATMSDIIRDIKVSSATVNSLMENGLIDISEETIARNDIKFDENYNSNVSLNEEQQAVCDSIRSEIDDGNLKPCLIKGVTGSGKTEVYMNLIEHTLESGKDAIVLIPEISLTYQTVMRFYARFGEKVSVINSRLSKGEKYDRFLLARKGRIRIMIGPRSALFTPFSNLGLIIIDEEHENAYKSETIPRYHARDAAVYLGELSGAKVVLGSATPSLESYSNARTGKFNLYNLTNRAGKGQMARVDVVDLREELHKGNKTMFSDLLFSLMKDRLEKNEQIMLFLNRRGYKGFINCRECGKVIECPHCAVSLTVHDNNRLVCHYCGYETDFVKKCPSCGSQYIGTFKAGTQKVEEEVKKLFPQARVLRMDLDTTKGKEGHDRIIASFNAHEADILIGTQMIVKGHDFSNVTLVGVLLADTSLHSPDYMASERTFELLTQAAGRAGRGEKAGRVVIQTYEPDNFSIRYAAAQDFEGFYKEEMAYRDLMDYPPVSYMMAAYLSSEIEEELINAAMSVKDVSVKADKDVKVIGPAKSPIYKIKDVFYMTIYYKSPDRMKLVQIRNEIEQDIKDKEQSKNTLYKNCQIQFDLR